MYCIGRLHFKGQVWAPSVVDRHRLGHHLARVCQICRATQQELAFQYSICPLGQRVLVAVVAVGYRAAEPVSGMDLLVIVRARLDAPTGVMDQPVMRSSSLQHNL